jgi:hypothetical protein
MSFHSGETVFVSASPNICARCKGFEKSERTISALSQDPVPEIWSYFTHPQLEDFVVLGELNMMREVAFVIDRSYALLRTWHAVRVSVRVLNVDNIMHNPEGFAFPFPPIGILYQYWKCKGILRLWWQSQVGNF